MAHILPLCKNISLIQDMVYLHYIRKGSISTSQWKIKNYYSLINGIKRACVILVKNGLLTAAEQMAATPYKYWYKIEKLPVLLTDDECYDVFSCIRNLYQEMKMPLWPKTARNKKAVKVLSLVVSGNDRDALILLKKRNKFLLLNKLYPIGNLLNFVFP